MHNETFFLLTFTTIFLIPFSILIFNYSEDFDWGELTYEDKITIEREIVNENVYRFWKDVNENDVVLDIGASVGAYTISILDQKPKKEWLSLYPH